MGLPSVIEDKLIFTFDDPQRELARGVAVLRRRDRGPPALPTYVVGVGALSVVAGRLGRPKDGDVSNKQPGTSR